MPKQGFYQGVHNHDVLVDKVHFPKGGKMQISPKLKHYCANKTDIRNQQPRLHRNRLILFGKAGVSKAVPIFYLFLEILKISFKIYLNK